jgi:hypothetical protein
MSMETLAAQMGTSRPMIERHYSKLRPEMKAAELSGWAERPKAEPVNGSAIDLSGVVKMLSEQNKLLMQKLEEIAQQSKQTA